MRRRVKRAELPPPCRDCRPNDGAWRRDPVTGGLERCGCPRGDVLAGRLKPSRKVSSRKPAHDGKAAATGE